MLTVSPIYLTKRLSSHGAAYTLHVLKGTAGNLSSNQIPVPEMEGHGSRCNTAAPGLGPGGAPGNPPVSHRWCHPQNCHVPQAPRTASSARPKHCICWWTRDTIQIAHISVTKIANVYWAQRMFQAPYSAFCEKIPTFQMRKLRDKTAQSQEESSGQIRTWTKQVVAHTQEERSGLLSKR